ncbi:MAG TPA: DUF1566 domain-containing protein [Polyangiaceae bacterium]|jgi:hypothetical protein|nr:DUF1566 domain-containing protein [Polyangiaceae bacterium]
MGAEKHRGVGALALLAVAAGCGESRSGAETMTEDACRAPAAPRFADWPMPNPAVSGLPNPMRYDFSHAGVLVDEVTGLMWQAFPSPELSWPDADTYCADLRAHGYCDWRTPSRIELVSLVDFSATDPALDPLFPVVDGEFFSASTVEEYRFALGSDGATRAFTATQLPTAATRCVRRELPIEVPKTRYVMAGQASDDLVEDQATGLVWQRRPSASTHSFAGAETYCAELALDGGGFRVPSMKELQTVLDEEAPNLIDAAIFPDFPDAPSVTFWTSTPSARLTARAWFVRGAFTLDIAKDAGLDAEYFVRCVR